jgi:hypothetical protein
MCLMVYHTVRVINARPSDKTGLDEAVCEREVFRRECADSRTVFHSQFFNPLCAMQEPIKSRQKNIRLGESVSVQKRVAYCDKQCSSPVKSGPS